jgi:glycine/D-amino acid oxidase-like deaminating enzyme
VSETKKPKTHVVIVGGGFAGLACARKLAKSGDVRVTLIDSNNSHAYRRSSLDSTARRRGFQSNTPQPASRRHGPPHRQCLASAPCLAWNRRAKH